MTTTNPDSAPALAGSPPAPQILTTGTRGTRVLGILTIVSMVWLVAFGLGFSPADRDQREAVRILYMHVPTIWVAYMAFVVTAIASAMVLYRSRGGRSLATAPPSAVSAERVSGAMGSVGIDSPVRAPRSATAFVAVTLVVGALWGRLTWGVFWQWDARLTTTALLFVTYIGYLAVRRLDGTHQQRAKRSAIIGAARRARDPARALECPLVAQPPPGGDRAEHEGRHRHGRSDAVQPVRRRDRLQLVLRLADDAPHAGDGHGRSDRRSWPRRRVRGPPSGRHS